MDTGRELVTVVAVSFLCFACLFLPFGDKDPHSSGFLEAQVGLELTL